jgi:hypothetical protein
MTWGFVVDNADIQEVVVSKIKADSALSSWLTSKASANEVREDEWQGADFTYPNVRVELPTQIDLGDPPCHTSVTFNVHCYAEGYSSIDCDVLAGLVKSSLRGKHLSGSGFATLRIASEGSIGAVQAGDRVWRATEQFSLIVRQD